MIKNAVSSLAMLSAINRVNKKDYVDNFVPFIATLIKKKNYTIIENDVICSDFKEEYGLSIPFHPMETILARARKKGIIIRRHGKFAPVTEMVSKYEFSETAKKQSQQQDKLISEIISYANETYNYKISQERTGNALLFFLKKYDLDILFASEAEGVLPKVQYSSKRDRFVIYHFIKNAYESDLEIFKFVVNIAIGNLIANFILYKDPGKIVGKLSNVCFYLDAPIIFRLTGFDGEEIAEAYNDFLKTLEKEGACIKIFKHTYEEVFQILDNSLHWIENPSYDPSIASATTRFFIRKGYTRLDVQHTINKTHDILQEHLKGEDSIVGKPTVRARFKFQEDEAKIRKLILDEYKKKDVFIEDKREATIDRDKDSISSIYILRKEKSAKCLSDTDHIFLTTNTSLAFVSNIYERDRSSEYHSMSACLTDTFVGTLLWLQSPAKIFEINKRKIIADCYAALQPSRKLIQKYVMEIDKWRREDRIDANSYYLLRSDSLAYDLLEEKTFGDDESFNSLTLEEIHREIKVEMQKEAIQKYRAEKEAHKKTSKTLDGLQKDHLRLTSTIETKATNKAKLISYILLTILLGFSICCIFLQAVPSFLQKYPQARTGVIIMYGLVAFFTSMYGVGLLYLRRWAQEKLKKIMIKRFMEDSHRV